MPVLIPHLTPQTVEIRSILNADDTTVSQGLEGRQVRKEIESVSQHWRQQSLSTLEMDSSELLDELSDYQHPP